MSIPLTGAGSSGPGVSGPKNETQLITFAYTTGGAAAAGDRGSITITVTAASATTGSIAFDASSAVVNAALDAITAAPGDVVAGAGMPGPIPLTYGGTLAGTDVAPVTVDTSSYFGPGSASIVRTVIGNVVTGTYGGLIPGEVVSVDFGDGNVFNYLISFYSGTGSAEPDTHEVRIDAIHSDGALGGSYFTLKTVDNDSQDNAAILVLLTTGNVTITGASGSVAGSFLNLGSVFSGSFSFTTDIPIEDAPGTGNPAIQTLTITAGDGGTYDLDSNTFNYNADAATIEAALRTSQSDVGLTVTGTNPFTITWGVNGPESLLVLNPASLTRAITANVTTTQNGG